MKPCIVVYNDGFGLIVPYGPDPDCDGALQATDGPATVFADASKARVAIKISIKFAELCCLQGKPANDDFLKKYRKNVRIMPVVMEGFGESS